jgi:hypothetical protein
MASRDSLWLAPAKPCTAQGGKIFANHPSGKILTQNQVNSRLASIGTSCALRITERDDSIQKRTEHRP